MKHLINLIIVTVLIAQVYSDDPKCTSVSLSARKDCGTVSTTPDQCVAKGCCWNVTTVANEPNCFFKSTGPPDPTSGPAPGDKKVYIHMMPWFETKATNGGKWGIHWTMANKNPDVMNGDKRQIASHFYPLIGPYASGDSHVIDWQLGLMKLSGVAGVLIDWPGTANKMDYPTNKRNAEAIIAGADRHGLEFAIVYEDHNLDLAGISDKIGQGRADMEYIKNNYMSKSNYIKVNGAPLLLDFGPQTLKSEQQWEQIFSPFSPKPTFLTLWNQMEEAGSAAKGEFAWIYSNFIDGLNNFYKYRNIALKFGCAYPGFDSFYSEGGWGGPGWKIPVSLSAFQQTFDLALANTEHVQIATWNDYGEGTIIEPTKEFGYAFLTYMQKKLGVSHTQADLEKVTQIFNGRLQYANNQTMLDQLEKEHFNLINS